VIDVDRPQSRGPAPSIVGSCESCVICASCGRHEGLLPEQSLTSTPAGLYLCPDCRKRARRRAPKRLVAAFRAGATHRAGAFAMAGSRARAAGSQARASAVARSRARASAVAGSLARAFVLAGSRARGSQLARFWWRGFALAGGAVLAVALVIAVAGGLWGARGRGTEGAAQGMAQPPPSTAPLRAAATAGATTVQPSNGPAKGPANVTPSTTPDPPVIAFQAGEPAVVRWRGNYGETRMQVIVPVRNQGKGWIEIPRSGSTYRLLQKGKEVASGVFTAALPATFGPGQTAYLVDTLSAAFVSPSGSVSTKADIKAIASTPPLPTFSVTDLQASVGAAGGLRVEGRVHNDGQAPAAWVIAGAVAVSADGRPLGAVYDPSTIGGLEPGSSVRFVCEYPGAPPLGKAARLHGVAFDAIDGPGG
jgi:hypothetical protein